MVGLSDLSTKVPSERIGVGMSDDAYIAGHECTCTYLLGHGIWMIETRAGLSLLDTSATRNTMIASQLLFTARLTRL